MAEAAAAVKLTDAARALRIGFAEANDRVSIGNLLRRSANMSRLSAHLPATNAAALVASC